MNKKSRNIAIVILTVAMIAMILIKGRNSNYEEMDVKELKLYNTAYDDTMAAVEEKSTDFAVVQNKIDKARVAIENLDQYVKSKGEEKYQGEKGSWSSMLDEVQNKILNNVNVAVTKAEQLRVEKYIDEARDIIPQETPEKIKNGFEERLNKIHVYENVDEEVLNLAENAYNSTRQVLLQQNKDMNIVQNLINIAKGDIKKLNNTLEDKNEDYYKNVLGAWSQTVDSIQNKILIPAVNATKKAEQLNRPDYIDNARKLLPNGLPEKLKNSFEDRWAKIVKYDVDSSILNLSETAYTQSTNLLNQNGPDINKNQQNINEAKKTVDLLRDKMKKENKDYYNKSIEIWYGNIETAQNKILDNIKKLIEHAKETNDAQDVEKAKKAIPQALPSQWKNNFDLQIKELQTKELQNKK